MVTKIIEASAVKPHIYVTQQAMALAEAPVLSSSLNILWLKQNGDPKLQSLSPFIGEPWEPGYDLSFGIYFLYTWSTREWCNLFGRTPNCCDSRINHMFRNTFPMRDNWIIPLSLGDQGLGMYAISCIWKSLPQPPKISGKDFTPNIQLLAFERVSIEPSSTQASSFLLNPYLLSLVDADGGRYIFPGEYEVFVGGSLPGEDSWSSSQALQGDVAVLHLTKSFQFQDKLKYLNSSQILIHFPIDFQISISEQFSN